MVHRICNNLRLAKQSRSIKNKEKIAGIQRRVALVQAVKLLARQSEGRNQWTCRGSDIYDKAHSLITRT